MPKAISQLQSIIPYSETMKLENLKQILGNKILVIVSEDGQSANQVSALYNLLGYNSQVLLHNNDYIWFFKPDNNGDSISYCSDYFWTGKAPGTGQGYGSGNQGI